MVASKTPYTIEQAETDITDLRGMVYLLDELLTQYDGHVPNLPSASGYSLYSFGGQGCTLGFDGNPTSILQHVGTVGDGNVIGTQEIAAIPLQS